MARSYRSQVARDIWWKRAYPSPFGSAPAPMSPLMAGVFLLSGISAYLSRTHVRLWIDGIWILFFAFVIGSIVSKIKGQEWALEVAGVAVYGLFSVLIGLLLIVPALLGMG